MCLSKRVGVETSITFTTAHLTLVAPSLLVSSSVVHIEALLRQERVTHRSGRPAEQLCGAGCLPSLDRALGEDGVPPYSAAQRVAYPAIRRRLSPSRRLAA